MSLFFKKPENYLGIDIGNSSIKMIELSKENKQPILKNYAFAEKILRIDSSKTEDMISQSVDIIKQICQKAGFTTKNVVAALHNFDVFTSVINIPETNVEDLENIIKTEAHKFVPIPLEDVVLDWKILGVDQKKVAELKQKHAAIKEKKDKKDAINEDLSLKTDQGIDVLLTAAPRKLVKKYVDIFKASELNLLSLETESFAFMRALLNKNDNSSLMIIDIGAVATDIIIIEKQVPVIIRTVDGGGASITDAIANNLGINTERAEQFKRDIGIAPMQKGEEDNNQVIRQLIESSFVPVVNEISYSLDLYKSRKQTIDRIILSGGSAYLLHLVEFLKSTFQLPVYIGDPWHKINYPEELIKQLQEIGPMFTVAIGLALKQIVE